MILKKEKLLIKSLVALVLLVFSCSKDEKSNLDSSGQERVVTVGTTDTIVYLRVDGFEVPVYLTIPKECEEPMPAVVVMHGSYGMWAQQNPSSRIMAGQSKEWQSIFAENCIVGAFVDSYSGRGVISREGKWRELPDNFRISAQFVRPKDANAALDLLQNLKYDDITPIVQQEDIALLGFSDGASAVASTLIDVGKIPNTFEWTQSEDGRDYDSSNGVLPPQAKPEIGFSGGVFYYGGSVGYNYWGSPACGSEAMEGNVFYPYAPMLYNIPADDNLTENTLCMVDVLQAKNAPVKLNFYQGARHGFDFNSKGNNVPESETARKETIEWLKQIWSNN